MATDASPLRHATNHRGASHRIQPTQASHTQSERAKPNPPPLVLQVAVGLAAAAASPGGGGGADGVGGGVPGTDGGGGDGAGVPRVRHERRRADLAAGARRPLREPGPRGHGRRAVPHDGGGGRGRRRLQQPGGVRGAQRHGSGGRRGGPAARLQRVRRGRQRRHLRRRAGGRAPPGEVSPGGTSPGAGPRACSGTQGEGASDSACPGSSERRWLSWHGVCFSLYEILKIILRKCCCSSHTSWETSTMDVQVFLLQVASLADASCFCSHCVWGLTLTKEGTPSTSRKIQLHHVLILLIPSYYTTAALNTPSSSCSIWTSYCSSWYA